MIDGLGLDLQGSWVTNILRSWHSQLNTADD